MIRSEAVSRMKITLGFRRDLDDACVSALQLAQTTLESEPVKPWFLLNENSTIRTSAGEERIPLPMGFLEEYEEGALTYVPDDLAQEEVLLSKADLDDLYKKYPRSAVGTPVKYAAVGQYFRIFPTPDSGYLLRLLYYKQDFALTSDIENSWLKHAPLLLIGYAGLLLAPGLRDPDATKVFNEWTNSSRARLYAQNESRKHSNMQYQIGGPD